MKKIMTSILFLLVTLPMFAQQQRIVEKVDVGLYQFTALNEEGKLHQIGFYREENGTLIEHGIWRDEFGTKALFDNGDLVWIKPKGQKKYTSDEIQLHRLKRKVEMLEQKITSL